MHGTNVKIKKKYTKIPVLVFNIILVRTSYIEHTFSTNNSYQLVLCSDNLDVPRNLISTRMNGRYFSPTRSVFDRPEDENRIHNINNISWNSVLAMVLLDQVDICVKKCLMTSSRVSHLTFVSTAFSEK